MFTTLRSLGKLLHRRQAKRHVVRAGRTSRLVLESLESRRVLASTGLLPSIMGTVYQDADGSGTLGSGEALAGVVVRLYEDDGDGVFEPGAGDSQVGADFITLSDNAGTTADETGTYCFDSLNPDANYFVQQPAQTVGADSLDAQVSSLLSPGTPDLIIDEFVTPQSTIAVPPPVSLDNDSLTFVDESEVIGRERDLAVELTMGNSEVELRVNPFGLDDVLLFDSSAGTQGMRAVTWDGVDGDGLALGLGLNGRDLTEGGANTAIMMRLGVDANGASSRLRLYQGSATNFSEATVPIPVTGGAATGFALVPFSSFAGPVSATNVDAIQLILDTGNSSVDGQVDVVGALGPEIQDFANTVAVDLELNKSVDAAIVDNGDNVTWTLTLTNNAANGNTSATGVQVSDALPAGVTLVSATPSGNGTFANGVWSLVDPLALGDTATLTLVTSVNANVSGGTVLTNTAQVAAVDQMDVDSTPNNDNGDQSEDDEDAASTTVRPLIDLELDKTVDATMVGRGDTATFTITVNNNQANANTSATGVQVSDLVPAGLTLTSATPSGNGAFNNGVWSLVDPLAPGAAATLILVTTVDAGVSGGSTITNVAQVSAANQTDVDSSPGNDTGTQSEDDEDQASVTIDPVIDLQLTKTVSAPTADVGDSLTWNLSLVNSAPGANAAATGVQVTDALPTGVTLVSAAPSGNGTFSNGVWDLVDPLPVGATASLGLTTTVNSTVAGGSTLINTAQVSAANEPDVDSTPNNDNGDQSEDDEAAAQVAINAVIDLELTKTASRSNVLGGDSVTWTVSVSNNAANANAPATGVQVTDVVPSGVSLVSANPSGNGVFSGNVWNLVDPLAAGATANLVLETTVDGNVVGGQTITNVAQVSAANETDVDSAPNNDNGDQSEDDEDAAVVTVDPVIDLTVAKTVDRSSVQTGDTVTWTVEVRNDDAAANTNATGVQVSDVLPASDVAFVSSSTSNGAYSDATGVWTLATPLSPGQVSSLDLVTTVNTSASGRRVSNVAQVTAANETDVDSVPNNDNGDQSEDDEAQATINVAVRRPTISKRDLLASSGL